MVSFSVIFGSILLLGLVALGAVQMVMDTSHGTELAGAVVVKTAQRDLNLCMNECMHGCVTSLETQDPCSAACARSCGA
jgi:hypothetical protein